MRYNKHSAEKTTKMTKTLDLQSDADIINSLTELSVKPKLGKYDKELQKHLLNIYQGRYGEEEGRVLFYKLRQQAEFSRQSHDQREKQQADFSEMLNQGKTLLSLTQLVSLMGQFKFYYLSDLLEDAKSSNITHIFCREIDTKLSCKREYIEVKKIRLTGKIINIRCIPTEDFFNQ